MKLLFVSNYFQLLGSLLLAVSCLYKLGDRKKFIKLLALAASASIVISVAQQVSVYHFSAYGINFLGNAFTLIEATIFVLIFLSFNTKSSTHMMVVGAIYWIYYALAMFLLNPGDLSTIRLGRDLLVIVLVLFYFFHLIRELPEDRLKASPVFWFCASSLLYFSGTFILSVLIDYIVKVRVNEFPGFWSFRNFFRFAYCITLCFVSWMEMKSTALKVQEIKN